MHFILYSKQIIIILVIIKTDNPCKKLMGNKGSDNQYQYPQFQIISDEKHFIPYSNHQGYNFN